MNPTARSRRHRARRVGASLLVGSLGLGAVGLLPALPAQAQVETPVEEPVVVQVETPVADGTIDWGVKQSFRSYVTGPAGQGTVATSSGATTNLDGTFRFPVSTGALDTDAPLLTAQSAGAVQFVAHAGALDLTFSNLGVQADGDRASLVADVVSRRLDDGGFDTFDDIVLADLDLDVTGGSTNGLVHTWTGVPASLTAEGSTAFGGFYAAGTALDPVTLTIGLEGEPPTWSPSVAVSKVAGIDPEGETVTITGTGFDPLANISTRPPVPAGLASGFYLAFGRFADPWRPSAGAPSGSRSVIDQRWVMPQASIDAAVAAYGPNPQYTVLNDDGSFSVTLDVAADDTKTGRYGVATWAAGGATPNASQETFTPMAFTVDPPVDPPVDPNDPTPPTVDGPDGERTATGPEGQTLTVRPARSLDPAGATVSVQGAGYDTAVGIYLAFCVDQGPGVAPSPCFGGADQTNESPSSVWITDNPPPYAAGLTEPFGPGGTLSFDISFAAVATDTEGNTIIDCLDGETRCVVTTRADHTAASDRSADVKVPVTFVGQEEVVEPEALTPWASLDVSTARPGDVLTVAGGGFHAGEQVEVWLHSDPQWLVTSVADANGAISQQVTLPLDLAAGPHHLELVGVSSRVSASTASFTVTAAVTPATGTLPSTGWSPGLLVAAAALLALGGGLALMSGRLAAADQMDRDVSAQYRSRRRRV